MKNYILGLQITCIRTIVGVTSESSPSQIKKMNNRNKLDFAIDEFINYIYREGDLNYNDDKRFGTERDWLASASNVRRRRVREGNVDSFKIKLVDL